MAKLERFKTELINNIVEIKNLLSQRYGVRFEMTSYGYNIISIFEILENIIQTSLFVSIKTELLKSYSIKHLKILHRKLNELNGLENTVNCMLLEKNILFGIIKGSEYSSDHLQRTLDITVKPLSDFELI